MKQRKGLMIHRLLNQVMKRAPRQMFALFFLRKRVACLWLFLLPILKLYLLKLTWFCCKQTTKMQISLRIITVKYLFVWYFTDRSKAVLLLWIFYVFVLSCVCNVFVRVCLYVLCGHLLGKGWPLGSRLWCLLWVCHFPIGILGQVWYLIVLIPDLCFLTHYDSLRPSQRFFSNVRTGLPGLNQYYARNIGCVSLAPKWCTLLPRLHLKLKPNTWLEMGSKSLQSRKNRATVLTLWYEP